MILGGGSLFERTPPKKLSCIGAYKKLSFFPMKWLGQKIGQNLKIFEKKINFGFGRLKIDLRRVVLARNWQSCHELAKFGTIAKNWQSCQTSSFFGKLARIYPCTGPAWSIFDIHTAAGYQKLISTRPPYIKTWYPYGRRISNFDIGQTLGYQKMRNFLKIII